MFPREQRCGCAATLGRRGTMPSRWTRVVHWMGLRSFAPTSDTLRAQVLRQVIASPHKSSPPLPFGTNQFDRIDIRLMKLGVINQGILYPKAKAQGANVLSEF